MSSMEGQPSKDMIFAKSVMKDLGETVQNFHTNALSVLSLSEQWKTLQSSLAMAEGLLSSRRKEVELKERKNDEISKKVECLLSGVERMKVELDLREKLVDQRVKEVDFREKDGFETMSKEEEFRERERVLELRERELSELSGKLELNGKERSLREKGVGGVDEGGKGFETMSKEEIREKEKVLGLKEKELSELSRKLELKEKELNEGFEACCKDIEVKQEVLIESRKVVGVKEREMEMEEKEVKECLELLEARKKKKELELEERRINEKRRGLELVEREVDDRLRLVQLEEKEMSRGFEALKLKEKDVDRRSRVVERKEKDLSVGFRELELKEKEVDERFRAVERKEKVMELKEGRFNEQLERLKLKENALGDGRQQGLELGEKQMSECVEVVVLKVEQVDECCKDIVISEQPESPEFRGKQVAECCRNSEVKEKQGLTAAQTNDVRDLLMAEQTSETCRTVELTEKPMTQSLDEGCRSLEVKQDLKAALTDAIGDVLMKEQTSKTCRAVESAEKPMTQSLKVVEFEENQSRQEPVAPQTNDIGNVLMKEQINDTCKAVELTGEPITQSPKVVEFEEKQSSQELEADTSQVTNAGTLSLPSEIQLLCRNMDAEGVRSYLIKHVKECDIWDGILLDFLQLTSDPAKIVLEVIRSFYQLGKDYIPGDDCRAGCVYILVQLMKIQPDIRPLVENEAKEFAAIWRSSLAKKGDNAPEIYCFLQFLASYKLAGSYDVDELLTVFDTFYSETRVNWPDQNPKLCQALGVTTMTGLIHPLIEGNKHLHAVIYICALQMEDAFPPERLLESHLQYIQKTVKEIVEEVSDTSWDAAANMELGCLMTVIKCISYFKLESKYSPVPLEMRIKQLQMEMGERTTENLLMLRRSLKLRNKKADAHGSVLAVTSSSYDLSDVEADTYDGRKRHASSFTSLGREKRSRLDAFQSLPPHSSSSLYENAANYWPYGNHVWSSRAFPSASSPLHHLGASGAV